MSEQLENFSDALSKVFHKNIPLTISSKNWKNNVQFVNKKRLKNYRNPKKF